MRCADGPSKYLFDSGTSGTYIQWNYLQAGKIGCSKQSLFFLAVFGIYHLLLSTHFLKVEEKIYIYQTWIVLEMI